MPYNGFKTYYSYSLVVSFDDHDDHHDYDHDDHEGNDVDAWQGTLWCTIMDPLAFWQPSASYYHIIVTSQR